MNGMRYQGEVAALWYSRVSISTIDPTTQYYWHGTRVELVTATMQRGRLFASTGDNTTRGVDGVYVCASDQWRSSLWYAVGVPLFNTRRVAHVMWRLRSTEQKLIGTGGRVHAFDPKAVEIDGSLIWVMDVDRASTDHCTIGVGCVSGVQSGKTTCFPATHSSNATSSGRIRSRCNQSTVGIRNAVRDVCCPTVRGDARICQT